jgi:hypothetical protein
MNLHAGQILRERASLTVTVSGMWWARQRIRLSIPLIWLAAKIAGVGFHLDIDRP